MMFNWIVSDTLQYLESLYCVQKQWALSRFKNVINKMCLQIA